MHQMRLHLQDGTEVTLTKTDDTGQFPYRIAMNGTDKCLYNTFEHAWDDLGKVVQCKNYQEAVDFI
ncbi:hypothetical protein [Burkholderia vietnamiensis]|uniref:hypothetical protein n=1 Tax=Burkholderia vietnamiensis TaxID=60552 RepID=UPI002651D241|nr:hypothetical protein [Burkholderia vietnamiensis]MDN8037418.1 hypothetical protein [Burkholderia vietnamiensis]